jgi:hypothetical protein
VNALLEQYAVEERVCSALDRDNGIARRWLVTSKLTGEVRLVALTKRGPGRWSAPPQFLCSCKTMGPCEWIDAVKATLPADTPPLAA